MIYSRIIVALTGLMYAGFGVAYLGWPRAMGKLTNFGLSSPLAATEIRAFYGGLEIGLAALLFVCAAKPTWTTMGLWAVALIGVGTVLGRLVGLVVDGSGSGFVYRVLAVEVLIVVLAAIGLLVTRS